MVALVLLPDPYECQAPFPVLRAHSRFPLFVQTIPILE